MLTVRRGGRARQQSKDEIIADLARRGVPFFDVDHRERPSVAGQRLKGVPRPAGTMYVNDQPVADSVQCKHCGGHFFMTLWAARHAGWCTNCGGFTCPKPECHPCIPFEKQLEAVERRAYA